MRSLRNIVAAAVATAALFGAGQARADFYDTPASTFPTTTVPFTGVPVTLPGFNKALGTLTSVIIHLSTTITDSSTIINSLNTAQAYSNATSTLTVTVMDSLGTTASAALLAGPFAGTVPANSGVFVAGTVTATVTGSTTDNNTAFFLTGPTITLSASGNTGSYTGSASAGVFFSGAGAAGGSVYLTYFYTPVPEPTSYALLGLGGIVGLAGRRALRRKKA